MNLNDLVQRHPVVAYFVSVFVLTWGGVLFVAWALASPGTGSSTTLVAIVALPMLIAPGLTSLALTALTEGRAGLGALWTRMTRWQVEGR